MAVAERSARPQALPAPSAAGWDGAILSVEARRVVEELREAAFPPSAAGQRALWQLPARLAVGSASEALP